MSTEALNPTRSFTSFLTGGGTISYTDHPTFTLTPMTGEEFSDTYIRPLAPAQILQLDQGNLSLDEVMRLCVQSVGDLRNANGLNNSGNAGSPGFYRLLADLRILQSAGTLSMRFQKELTQTRTFLVFLDQPSSALRDIADDIRRRLAVPPAAHEVEVVYGHAIFHRDAGTGRGPDRSAGG